MTDSVLIVGTGAMACLFAARLAAVGVQVTMLGTWPEGLAALEGEGVRLVDAQGRERGYPVRVTCEVCECAGAQLALVLVKSWQTERAARQLANCLAPEGVALSLQNGLGNREALAAVLGDERVALGVTTSGATLLAPGRVRPAGNGSIKVSLNPRLEPLADLLGRAGWQVEAVEDTAALLWSKLVINSAINPLTATLRVPNGELLERQAARKLMRGLAEETAAVARAQGISLTYPDPAEAAEAVARQTAGNRSSMLQDIQRRAPTEIDAICGAIVQAGERVGLSTPLNRTFWLLVKAVEGENKMARILTTKEAQVKE